MDLIGSVFRGAVGPMRGIVGDYLLSFDSAHLGARPSFAATSQRSSGKRCHKYWDTADGHRYYGQVESETGFGVSTRCIWYDIATAEPRASQNPGEPVCWHDSGKLDVPHRLGAPAWGAVYYVDGYRLPPDIGANFQPETFYTMDLNASNQLVFGRGPLHLKYTGGRLLIHGDAVGVPDQTVQEWIAERTVPAFSVSLSTFITLRPIVWGY